MAIFYYTVLYSKNDKCIVNILTW